MLDEGVVGAGTGATGARSTAAVAEAAGLRLGSCRWRWCRLGTTA